MVPKWPASGLTHDLERPSRPKRHDSDEPALFIQDDDPLSVSTRREVLVNFLSSIVAQEAVGGSLTVRREGTELGEGFFGDAFHPRG